MPNVQLILAIKEHSMNVRRFYSTRQQRCQWLSRGRIPRHRRHRHPRDDRREDVGDVGVDVVECGLYQLY